MNEVCSAIGLTEKEFRFVLDSIFIPNGHQAQMVFDLESRQVWVLRTEAYFSYLQYIEFCHANKHAKKAYWISVLAVIVSLVATLIGFLK